MVRKLLSATLSAALLLASPGGPGWIPFLTALAHAAEDRPSVDPQEALRYLQNHGVFSGADDPLRSHLYDDQQGRLTRLGQILYHYLQPSAAARPPSPGAAPPGQTPPSPSAPPRPADRSVEERLQDFRETLESMRRIGEIRTPEQRRQVEAAVERALEGLQISDNFKKLTEEITAAGLQGDMMVLNMRLRAAFDAASAAAKGDTEYIQINTPDGYVFADEQGAAFRQTKVMVCRHESWSAQTEPWTMTLQMFQQRRADLESWGYTCGEGGGVTNFSREIRIQQENMNKPENRPPGAPEVPVTGRYNYQMLQYGVARMDQFVRQLERAHYLDRMQRLATQLGKQFRPDQFVREGPGGQTLYNERLLRELEEEAARKEINERDGVCGRTVANARDLVDCRIEARFTELTRAKEALESYRRQVALFRNRQLITEAEIAEITNYERAVQLGATRTAVETYDLVADAQMQALGFELDVATVQRPRERTQSVWYNPVTWERSWWNPVSRNWEFNPISKWNQGLIRWTQHETPDAHFFRESLENAPVSKEVKEAYAAQTRETALRLGRLRLVYGELRERLRNADPAGGLDQVQAMFNAAQTELNEAQLDFQILTSLPTLAKTAHDSVSDNMWGVYDGVKRGVAWAWYKGWSLFDGGEAERAYWAQDQALRNALPVLTRAMELLSQGDRAGARRELLALSNPAVQAMAVDAFQAQGPVTDAARLTALLAHLQKTLTDKGKADLWFDTIVNLSVWSVGLALAAPIAAPILQGVGMAFSSAGTALINTGRLGALLGRPLYMVGAMAEHTAARLFTLSPAAQNLRGPWAMRQLHAFLYRTANAGHRIGSFALLAGSMSGVMGLYMPPIAGQPGGHAWNKDSPYASSWEAFRESAGHGAKWATESWHPMLLFAGVPATAFEGSRMARMVNSIANRGVVGNGLAFGRWVGSKLGRWTRATTSKAGTWVRGRTAAAGEKVARGSARMAEYQAGRDLLTIGRGGMAVVQMADHMGKFMLIGFAAKALGEAHVHARAVDGDDIERRVKRAQQEGLRQMEMPYWLLLPVPSAVHEAQGRAYQQSLEGLRQYKEANLEWQIANGVPDSTELPFLSKPKGSWMDFIFNKQWGGQKGPTGTFTVTEAIKLEALRSALPKQLAGRMPAGRAVRVEDLNPHQLYEVSNSQRGDVGRLKWSEELPQEAATLLRDYLRRRPDVAERIVFAAEGETISAGGRSFQVKSQFREEVAQYAVLDSIGGRPVDKRLLAKSRELLKDTLGVQEARATQAQKFLKSLLAETPTKQSEAVARRIRKEADEWAIRRNARDAKINALEKDLADAKTPEAKAAIQKRIDALKKGPTWIDMLAKWRRELTPEVQSGKLGRAFLDFIDYMEGAIPEFKTLKNAQGHRIPGWRPDQFSIQVEFFGSLLEGGKVDAANLQYVLKAKTGVGKTAVYGVGLLPFLEAYSQAFNIKLIFTTVKSNLLAQAKGDFRAFRRILTKTEFMTYSEFQAKLAEGKLDLTTGPRDWLVMGDEVDGGALQAQLSIGMGTGQDAHAQTGHKMLMDMDKTLRALLDRGVPPAQMARTWRAMSREQGRLVYRSRPADGVRKSLLDFFRGSSPQARRLDANARLISGELRSARPGWEIRVRQLLDQRARLVDAAVSRRNPITEAYGYGTREALKWARNPKRHLTDGDRVEITTRWGERNLLRLAKRLESAGLREQAQAFRSQAARLRRIRRGIQPEETALRGEKRLADREVRRAHRDLERIDRLYDSEKTAPKRKAQLQQDRLNAEEKLQKALEKREGLASKIAEFDKKKVLALDKEFGGLRRATEDVAAVLRGRAGGEASPEAAALRQARRMLDSKRGFKQQQELLEEPADKFHAKAQKEMVRLARRVSWRMMWAYVRDPFIAPQVRWQQFWKYFGSWLLPKFGFGGRGSFALELVYGMAKSYEYAEGRDYQINKDTGKIEIIVGSDSLPGLDTVGVRQALEWKNGLDITRPLSHRSISGFPDVLKARFVSMTGTVGQKLQPSFSSKTKVLGRGSEARRTVGLELYSSPRQVLGQVHTRFRDLIKRDLDRVARGEAPDGLMPVGLPSNRTLHDVVRMLRERPLVFRSSEMTPQGEAWLRRSGFTVRRAGGDYHVHPTERNIMGIRIQKVGAKELTPAQLGFTENATVLEAGTAKLVLGVTSKAGRGVDLPFKAGGYRHYEMLILEPQFVSSPEFTQLLGRIDLGRIPPGSTRIFRMLLTMESAYRETYFSAMLREEPVFARLRDRYYARLERFASRDGVLAPDARHYQLLIDELRETLRAAPRRDGALVRPQDLRLERLIASYERAVWRALIHGQMAEAEIRGYQASGTGRTAGRFNPYQRGLDPVPLRLAR